MTLRVPVLLLIFAAAAAAQSAVGGAKVVPAQYNGDLRNLPQSVITPKASIALRNEYDVPTPQKVDQTVRQAQNVALAPMPAATHFAGLSFTDSVTGGQAGAGWPPDINGDVGRNHYIESVNDSYAVYNKAGTRLAAFTENALWSGVGTSPCNGNSAGDPVVLYDQFADRWILTHFAFAINGSTPVAPFYECIAVSKTSDPVSGGWWLYAFRMDTGTSGQPPTGTLNDYPKFGIWNDGCLYMSTNEFTMPAGSFTGYAFASFSRSDMEAGLPATWALGFSNTQSVYALLPSTLYGVSASNMPPSGTPNYFISESGSGFSFEVRKFTPGTNCGGGGTLSGPTQVSQTAYTQPADIPQPNTSSTLDSLGDRLMQKAQYQRQPGRESLWVVHTVRTSGASPAAIQWAQIDVTGGTIAATPVQQQIYAPDASLNRWMPSIAVDRAGNVAIGYTTSNGTAPNFPTIAYSGRLVGDPLNNLSQTETVLISGSGSQNLSSIKRWGDYTSMSVDPSDECTFWYTNEYYSSQANGNSGNWQTRIGSFKFPTCALSTALLGITKTHTGNFTQGQNGATFTVTVTNTLGAPSTSGTVTVTDTLPSGLSLVSMAGSGWNCASNVCSRSDALAGGASYPVITVTVNVAANATPPQVNSVTVSGGGSPNATATDTVLSLPSLSLAKGHSGTFSQGQNGATYTLTVSNAANAGATNGTVTVTDTVPAGLSLVSMAGTGWNCAANSCTRSDSLAPGASYPLITVTVNVAANASSPLVNSATASGGGSVTANATDSTTIIPPVPANDEIGTATLIGSLPYSTTENTTAATTNPNDPAQSCGATSNGHTVWFKYQATFSGTLVVDTFTSDYDTVLSAYQGSVTAGTQFACNDDISPGVTSQISIQVSAGQVYYFEIAAWSSTTGGTLNLHLVGPPALSITKTHSGNFALGQVNAHYTATVSNQAGAPGTTGTVTVTETVPSGLSLVSMVGSGWTCTSNTCNRADSLAGGASYPGITVTVNVAANATTPQVNSISVSGGGSITATATDSTVIVQPALSITKTHSGNFVLGQLGATYSVVVANQVGMPSTSGTVTVTETVPAGLTLVSMAGTGWNCAANTCTRSDALVGGGIYPTITVTVNVLANASSPVVNAIGVSGGGSVAANTTDSTIVTPPPLSNDEFATATLIPTLPASITQNTAGATFNAADPVQCNGSQNSKSVWYKLVANFTGQLSVDTQGTAYDTVLSAYPSTVNALTVLACNDDFNGTLQSQITFQVVNGQTYYIEIAGFGALSAGGNMNLHVLNPAGLSITKSHSGDFTRNQNGTYSLTVSNAFGSPATSGLVTVTESVPAGLTLVSMSGSGWICTTLPFCTRSDVLSGGLSYPPITVSVTAAANAPPVVTNSVSVSGGGFGAASTTDPTNILVPALAIGKSHSGNFTQGQNGATYTVTVSNGAGAGSTSGTVTVTETVPSGLTLVSMAGTGWICASNNCTRSDSLAAGASYPPITVTVNVGLAAPSPQVNTVGVSGGTSPPANTTDSTIINSPPPANDEVPGATLVGTLPAAITQSTTSATSNATDIVQCNAFKNSRTVWFRYVATFTGQLFVDTFGTNYDTVITAYSGTPAAVSQIACNDDSDGTSQSKMSVSVTSGQTYYIEASGVGANNPGGALTLHVYTVPVLTVTKSHTGNFLQGQSGVAYSITVSNTGASPTSGTVTVTEAVPAGLALASMAGTGWACAATTCTRSDALAGGASYPTITVTVNVAAGAASPQVNAVTVSGGGSVNATATDSTIIVAPLLSIAKSHAGSFTQGQVGATYTLVVSNAAGSGATSGSVTVTENPPTGLSVTSMSGTGWACSAASCSRADVLAGGASYPPITATVTVAADATSPQVNAVTVSGGGSVSASSSDTTIVLPPQLSITKSHTGDFTQGQASATYTLTVSNAAGAGASHGTVTVTEVLPAGLSLVSMTGSTWFCVGNTCLKGDILAGGASYPPIIVTVNVASNAPTPTLTNQATVSGGGSAIGNASDVTNILSASVTLISPANGATGVPLNAALSWNPVAGATSYDVYLGTSNPPPLVTTTTSTSYASPGLLFSQAYFWRIVAKAGGNSVTSVVSSFTTGTNTAPALTIVKTHSGSFTQGQAAATYTVTVGNSLGSVSTSGVVTVTDTLPTGLTLVSMAGTGWTCVSNACTRSDPLSTGSSYPAITVTVGVAANAPSQVTNQATVSGGGSASSTANDPTTISTTLLPPAVTVFTPAQGATGVPTSTTLTWLTVAGATSYDVYFGTSASPPLVGNTASGSFSPGALSPGTTYFWQIAAKNSFGSTPSIVVSFTTQGLSGYRFVPVTPCRVMDTRNPAGTFGGPSISGNSTRTVPIPLSACGIPANAQAYSLNITVVPGGPLSYLSIWPAGQPQPVVSTLNSFDGRVVANAAIVPAGSNGAVNIFATDNTHAIVDINGYFAPASTAGSMSFYTTAPCRLVDTRGAVGPFGGPFMPGGSTRNFPIPFSPCGIPSNAQAYSLNITVLPHGPLGYLTTWPTGQTQPFVSTLNSLDGSVVANAAIVPAGTGGSVSAFVTDNTDVIIDINGYFAPPGSSGALLLYTTTPCRLVDTRNGPGPFGGPAIPGGGARSFPIPSSGCGIPGTAQAYSLNVTVVPPGPLIYVTAWPTGQPQPNASTLNSFAGKVVANAAVVPAGNAGAVNIFASDATHLILDINAYFAQ